MSSRNLVLKRLSCTVVEYRQHSWIANEPAPKAPTSPTASVGGQNAAVDGAEGAVPSSSVGASQTTKNGVLGVVAQILKSVS